MTLTAPATRKIRGFKAGFTIQTSTPPAPAAAVIGTIVPLDNYILTVPVSSVPADADYAQLLWSDTENGTYTIYQNNIPALVTTNVSVNTVIAATKWFKTNSINAYGNTLSAATSATSSAGSTATPNQMVNLRVTSKTTTSLTYAWDALANVTSYTLQRWNGTDWTTAQVTGITDTTYTINTLTANTEYGVRGRGVNTNAAQPLGAFSAETWDFTESETLPVPVPPVVTWQRISSTVIRFLFADGEDATSWNGFYRTPAGSGLYSDPVSLTVDVASYDVDVSINETADFYITATNAQGSANSNIATGSAAIGNWQLDIGHYEPSKAEPIIVFPRTDASSHSAEVHRLAPAGYRWRIPVAMYSGSWPFYYFVDATSAGKGITIGAQLSPAGEVLVAADDYAELSWESPTVGSHTITVSVRTQEYGRNTSGYGDEKTVTFTLVVVAATDTTKFVWLSDSGNDTTGAGTPASPFRSLAKIFNSSSYVGRQLHLLAGTYDTTAASTITLNTTSAPAAMIGVSGQSVVLNLNQRVISLSSHGCQVIGVSTSEGGHGATVGNQRIISVNNNINNWTIHRCSFVSPSNGTTGTDNPTSIYTSGGGGRLNGSITRCTESGRTYTSNSGGLFISFAADQVVAEFNSVTGGARYNMIAKDSNRKWSMRANTVNCSGSELALSTGCQIQVQTSENIEISYNKSNVGMRLNYQAVISSGVHHVFRNSLSGIVSVLNPSTAGTGLYNIDKNAIEGAVTTGSRVVITNAECHASTALDLSLNLQGTYRAGYLGTRGAEIG